MTSQTIPVPRDHTLDNIIGFSHHLEQIEPADSYTIDFQDPGFVTPFGMLLIGCKIKSFIKAHPEAKFDAVHLNNGYAWHMGFFQACGFDIGRAPGEAPGNTQYLPITILQIEDLKKDAREQILEIGEIVEKRSHQLAQVLTHQQHGDLVDTLTYTMREMIRNVIEHSRSEFIAYCAQYMPSKHQAEIAILDTGIGIQASLRNNPHLVIQTDRDALNLALMPGISGKMFKGRKQDPNNYWQNSGYGLYAVSRLCGFGGKFLIASGDVAMSLKPKGKDYHPLKFQGTVLRMNLSLKDIDGLQVTLRSIMKDGDRIAKELLGEEHIQASSASRMLSGEFKKQTERD